MQEDQDVKDVQDPARCCGNCCWHRTTGQVVDGSATGRLICCNCGLEKGVPSKGPADSRAHGPYQGGVMPDAKR